jgi:hypothetical protein
MLLFRPGAAMSENPRSNQPLEIESTDRWVAGKSEEQLLSDLKVYLARLRDDPRSLVDRLRVAAIQLRLGRVQEALIHYEGVLRGYVAEGQIMSAIALCQRILAIYPDVPRIQRILAALYARAPHGATGAATPVTPVTPSLEEQPTTSFVVAEQDEEVVDRVFPPSRHAELARRGQDLLTTDDLRPTMPYAQQARRSVLEDAPTTHHVQDTGDFEAPTIPPGSPMLLTRPKGAAAAPLPTTDELGPPETLPPETLPPEELPFEELPPEEEVVLLTKPKKKKK